MSAEAYVIVALAVTNITTVICWLIADIRNEQLQGYAERLERELKL